MVMQAKKRKDLHNKMIQEVDTKARMAPLIRKRTQDMKKESLTSPKKKGLFEQIKSKFEKGLMGRLKSGKEESGESQSGLF